MGHAFFSAYFGADIPVGYVWAAFNFCEVFFSFFPFLFFLIWYLFCLTFFYSFFFIIKWVERRGSLARCSEAAAPVDFSFFLCKCYRAGYSECSTEKKKNREVGSGGSGRKELGGETVFLVVERETVDVLLPVRMRSMKACLMFYNLKYKTKPLPFSVCVCFSFSLMLLLNQAGNLMWKERTRALHVGSHDSGCMPCYATARASLAPTRSVVHRQAGHKKKTKE